MSATTSIQTDHLRRLEVHRGDTLRVLEVHEENILVEIQHAHPAPPHAAGQASEWLRTAQGSVRLAPGESSDDARMAYYAEKYGFADQEATEGFPPTSTSALRGGARRMGPP